jgi:hypothetical protein
LLRFFKWGDSQCETGFPDLHYILYMISRIFFSVRSYNTIKYVRKVGLKRKHSFSYFRENFAKNCFRFSRKKLTKSFCEKYRFRVRYRENFRFWESFHENFPFGMRIRIQEPFECVSRSERWWMLPKLSRKPSREQKFFGETKIFANTFAKTKIFAKSFAVTKIVAKSKRIFAYFRFSRNWKRGFRFNPTVKLFHGGQKCAKLYSQACASLTLRGTQQIWCHTLATCNVKVMRLVLDSSAIWLMKYRYRICSHSTCIASPEAYLFSYESHDTYQKMSQDVINMPHVKQYKLSVKYILHFMSQMTLESGTIFTVWTHIVRALARHLHDTHDTHGSMYKICGRAVANSCKSDEPPL